jgi:hypothetical protein
MPEQVSVAARHRVDNAIRFDAMWEKHDPPRLAPLRFAPT